MTRFRQATIDDAKELVAIYAPYITNTTITFETEIPTIEDFQQRIKDITTNFPYLVAVDDDDKILGYAYAHLYGTRAAYAWTVEASIYVDHNYKGHGLGRELYQRLEAILKRQGVVNLLAAVTEENSGSVKFHGKLGYREVGTFQKAGFKFGRWLDVIWLQKELNPKLPEMKPIVPFNELS
ncbi:hypothetical protein C5L30_000795 [Companilactobacillus farciminis]|uniref:N-acetyltransferase domain-containing protein n=1 Tax=Companilactobacillus farciminis TaxID=1612 RepID=A0A4R5NDH3_9LACO|nr:GNAT family N-acetyltransferase [Companilactobacillus farciminis]ATO45515.1 GNAT family N-acetyltransferase [Companilactobacillus farciminis KCTC 3681 = DSM 20184]TDG71289.1 hypothetical protein C5L30_000795 [Companilactobacillus farciminis]